MTTRDDVLAALDSYTAGVVTAQQTADAQATAAVQAQLDAANAQVTQLQAQLAALTPVADFGVDISTNGTGQTLAQQYAAARAFYGVASLGPHMKHFDGGHGVAAAMHEYVTSGYGQAPGEVEPLICFKTMTTSELSDCIGWFGSKGQVVHLVPKQEDDDDIVHGYDTAANYRAMLGQVAQVARAHQYAKFARVTVVRNGYTDEYQVAAATAKGTDFVSLVQGMDFDVLGVDVYRDAWMPVDASPAVFLDPIIAAARTLGKPWAVCEFGMQVSTNVKTPGDSIDAVAARFTATLAYARQAPGFAWLCWWHGSGANGDWRPPAGSALAATIATELSTTGAGQ